MHVPAPTDADVNAYGEAVYRLVLRRLARRADVSPFDADDIAMETVERFLADPAAVMAHYPEPHVYAAACAASRTEDWRRKERAQRSEGARLVVGADGAPAVARPVGTLSTLLPGQMPVAAAGYEAVELLADLRAALATLDRTDRELVVHVDVLGYSVTDAALLVGMSRCHASRRHTQALARLAASLQEPLAC